MPDFAQARRTAFLLAGAALIVLGTAAVRASAGDLYREHVYADSFGNLVVYSPAGYKRIVVGRGYLAHRMAAQNKRPKVVYFTEGRKAATTCEHHAVLLHGRSYMYGLPENVVPEPAAGCS